MEANNKLYICKRKLKRKRMKDYIDKINNKKKATSITQEPALAIAVRQTTKSAKKRLEASMPCFFSEEELNKVDSF